MNIYIYLILYINMYIIIYHSYHFIQVYCLSSVDATYICEQECAWSMVLGHLMSSKSVSCT